MRPELETIHKHGDAPFEKITLLILQLFLSNVQLGSFIGKHFECVMCLLRRMKGWLAREVVSRLDSLKN